MMVVDASALVAIGKGEPDSAVLFETLIRGGAVIGAPSVVETKFALSSIMTADVLDRFLAKLIQESGLVVVDFTPAMADAAVLAFRRYGKGRGHPAQLNFGDCMAYAVARVRDLPLLYKGEDFRHTDIVPALP